MNISRKEKEKQRIRQIYDELIKEYLDSNHSKKTEIIEKAFTFAEKAHDGARRLSGEPYIVHPLEVALIVCKDIGLGSTSICAALLHDVVEDTDYTIDDIRALFGDRVALLVDGLTKISGGIFGEQASVQAENFRKFVITMSEDIRVALIKMADRLHNMRTLESQTVDKQYKISSETEYIYAPLAHRLGLSRIKTELENLCFKYKYPDEYADIAGRLESERAERMALYKRFAEPITSNLDLSGYHYTMKERIKSVHSIWKKMQAKHIPYEEVYDILGARIIFEPKNPEEEKLECWKIYNLITQIYRPHPERTRDWLSTPKANGYEALHLTVMGPNGKWIEVQIRSKRMDDIAEKGLAAHWVYKRDYNQSESKIDEWLTTVNELLKSPDTDAMNFLDNFKLTLYDSEIFVFTPMGEMKTIPIHSTALDFAFAIHSDIGMHCVGAKVNNKLVPLSHELSSGDQVEILTAAMQKPTADWLNYVTTARAKEKISAVVKHTAEHFHHEGNLQLRSALEAIGIHVKKDYSADLIQSLTSHYQVADFDQLLCEIGEGKHSLNELSQIVKPKNKRLTIRYWTPNFLLPKKGSEKAVLADSHRIAQCCKPIPGDEIIGFIGNDGQITIHKRSCPEAIRISSERDVQIVQADWTYTRENRFNATVQVIGIDRPKMLLTIISVISDKLEGNIKSLNIDTKDGVFKCDIVLYVN
ncbi:MAG: bifunctional (p)ppGpp synthetase/guanosine-3',5'-bis(diphosphate) 3'-pyrophosphohydrolase, partial [Paludibacteraceae bacterium]|nr:bifunctional (p)ppGpp synthetase/guanosine-3',5'-bis(diphosphate) 3'-pyrophosphohydrolase [Paludibacteraceae bacterium]